MRFSKGADDRDFDARSIAVVGAKKVNGFTWFRQYKTFAGTVSSVHVNPDSIRDIEAMGIRNYSSILEVPRPVDYVVVNTPRRLAVETFAQCVEAGVGAVSYFTSGFAETDEEGLRIQETLVQMSRESGVPIWEKTGVYNPGADAVDNDMRSGSRAGRVVSERNPRRLPQDAFAWHGRARRAGSAWARCGSRGADWMSHRRRRAPEGAVAISRASAIESATRKFRAALRRVTAKTPVVTESRQQRREARGLGQNTAANRSHRGLGLDYAQYRRRFGVGTMEALSTQPRRW